jgi:hypothetical protein
MNRFHRRYCAGAKWDALMRERLLPDALDGVELGDNVLELGPGPGLTTQALAPMTTHLTVVCMTMLHHLSDAAAQDRLFAQARRVLRPGGVFCGSDNLGRGLRFRLIHLGDTRTVVDPDSLPARLTAAGFDRADVRTTSRLIFHAYTPV